MRGDLIEAFKIMRGFVDYGQNLFKLSISGLNILSKITKDTTSDRSQVLSYLAGRPAFREYLISNPQIVSKAGELWYYWGFPGDNTRLPHGSLDACWGR